MTLRTTTDKATGVALLTLDRPDRLNAIDLPMAEQLAFFWQELRFDETVRAVVVTGAGERAFCTGLDRDAASAVPQPNSPYTIEDPLLKIGPKSNDCWKPLIAAVNGMACGGAFYLLGESEFLVADPAATFFDPHTTYGMVSAFESILMAQRMPYGEAARMALLGTAERMSAKRAHEVGLVSEVTEPGEAVAAALRCAEIVAGCPPEAVEGTVRACWAAREATRSHALALAPHLISLGNQPGDRQAELYTARRRDGFRMR
ncbi:enoyl-CoA hydratase/isomerase family protein [Streptomyces sp. ATCC 21386]|uniref:enoyl-CoA hydratase/isomerase family protein n=1 Tax=Streptomyces sp. ATCC 21386 TaxID=2699428 RepID=UPI001BFFA49A|nr:enoyl-CoA hydratase/isomerase family protein [Streptomyces sp. ATCC 21386]